MSPWDFLAWVSVFTISGIMLGVLVLLGIGIYRSSKKKD